MTYVRVGLDVPVNQLFDYSAPDATIEDVGRRVVVPFGKRSAIGVIVEVDAKPAVEAARVKPVLALLRDEPRFSSDDLRLLKFAAQYYQYPLGRALVAALPTRLRHEAAPPPSQRVYALTAAGHAAANGPPSVRAPVRLRLLTALRGRPYLTALEVNQVAPSARAALNALIACGWVEARNAPESAAQGLATSVSAAPVLTSSQAAALEAISAKLGRYGAFLLHGVTGSGKTEVYLGAAARALQHGRQVLILVPEIALTPQLEALVQARFPGTVLARLHSGLGERERLENWRTAQSGAARIVLGTRLAIFVPLPQLGLIVVDEEHDTSFKQTEGFCYCARDLAVVRASQRALPVVLGSATPALETYHNAQTGRYTLLELPQRVNARPPAIALIPVNRAALDEGLAPPLLAAVAARLEQREQTLIFINRRGYAPVIMCHACGWLSGCHRCSAQLVLHLAARELRCHHCGHCTGVPEACPACGNPALAPVGQGTQRIEAALARHFPQARILRIDRDTTRRRQAWAGMRRRIQAREVDVLVGTQMLAKGHDFPHLGLVGILNADGLLYSADFRASERLFALLTQVAGRAGRANAPGEVLIQTEFPAHPLYTALCSGSFAQFAHTLLTERRAARFPPYTHQALLRAQATRLEAALAFLESAKRIGLELSKSVELYDPVPAAIARLAGRERAQLLVQCASRRVLQAFLEAWRARLAVGRASVARWALDVDPIEL
jgi:primosomal protein N' (replication factor Y) (superfamily II helicase)